MKPKSQEIALRTRPSRTDYSLSRPPGTDRVCRTSPAVSQRRIRQHHKRGPGVASMTYSSNMRRGISGRGHAHTHEPEFSGGSPHSPIPTWARASCPGRGRPRGRVSGAAVGGVPRPPRSGDDERGEKIRPILSALVGSGHTIRTVRAHRPSLEDLFMATMEDSETGETIKPGAIGQGSRHDRRSAGAAEGGVA